MVQNETNTGTPTPMPLPKLLLTVHTSAYASFTIDLAHDDAALGPCLYLRSYLTKRNPLSPSPNSYRNFAGIFALASAETLQSRNTIDYLNSIVPLPRSPAMHAFGTEMRGHLDPYLCRNCPILTPLFTTHKLDRASPKDSSLPYSARFLTHLFSAERWIHTAVYASLISIRHRTIRAPLAPASVEPTHS